MLFGDGTGLSPVKGSGPGGLLAKRIRKDADARGAMTSAANTCSTDRGPIDPLPLLLTPARPLDDGAGTNACPVTLELGGKSPQLVFADADLERALPFLVNAGIQNAGQTCSAGSRILIERSRYAEVVERMAERYRALRVGPADADLDVGPLISARQKAIVESFIRDGADLATAAEGTIVPDAPSGGHYLAPTLFAGVKRDHRLAQEEIFGPVQVAIPFDDEADAVAIANGTGYGLVAGVWTCAAEARKGVQQ